MSFLDQSKWREWAREWGFIHAPQKMWTYPNEWIAGRYRNHLVRAGWGGDRGRRLYVLVRYPAGVDPGTLWKQLENDDRLAALPGWKKLKPRILPAPIDAATGARRRVNVPIAPSGGPEMLRAAGLDLTEHLLLWTHDFTLRRPKPAQVRAWVEALVGAAERWTPAFDDRCEECHATRVDGFVLIDGAPALLCSGCQEHRTLEGRLQEQRYDQEDANHFAGFALGAVAALVGGGLWALIAIGTGRMFALAALGIGALVAWCWRLGAHKVDVAGRIGAGALTLAGVAFGEVAYYTYGVMQLRPDVGFRLDIGFLVMLKVMMEAPGDVLFSLMCGGLGAWVAVRALAKPKFVPQIQSAQEAVTDRKRKAA